MKKSISLAAIVLSSFFIFPSCSTTKNTAAVATVNRGRVSGTWMVNSISYDGLIENNVQRVFDLAAPSAFQGSTWNLTNSGNGSIALNNGTNQAIYWSLYNAQNMGPALFQFKKINAGEKPKNIEAGYRMDVSSVDGNNLVLRTPIQTGASTAYIVFNMIKK